MKRKVLFVGATLLLAVPLFVLADGQENTKINSELPQITMKSSNEVNDMEDSRSTNSQRQFDRPCMNNENGTYRQGRHMMGQTNMEQRAQRDKELLDIVKQYDPERLNEWESVIQERTKLHEQMFEQNGQINNRQGMRGQGRGQGMMSGNTNNRNMPMNGRAMMGNNEAGQEVYCQALDGALASGNKAEISKQLNEMLNHLKERNEWMKNRLNEMER